MVVSTLLLKKEGKVLLLRKPKHGFYVAPGGKHEENETPKQAAVREFYEETGLTVRDAHLRAISHVEMREKKFTMYTFFSDDFTGELTEFCKEGTLNWEDVEKLQLYPMAEGDRIVLTHAVMNNHILEANVKYDEDYSLATFEIIK